MKKWLIITLTVVIVILLLMFVRYLLAPKYIINDVEIVKLEEEDTYSLKFNIKNYGDAGQYQVIIYYYDEGKTFINPVSTIKGNINKGYKGTYENKNIHAPYRLRIEIWKYMNGDWNFLEEKIVDPKEYL